MTYADVVQWFAVVFYATLLIGELAWTKGRGSVKRTNENGLPLCARCGDPLSLALAVTWTPIPTSFIAKVQSDGTVSMAYYCRTGCGTVTGYVRVVSR